MAVLRVFVAVVCVPLQRAHKVSRLLQQQAASSLTAPGAAAAAQRQLQTITAAAAAAGAAAPAGPPQTVATAAAAAEVVAAAGAGAGRAGVHRLAGAGLGLGLSSLSAGFAGGMGLPAELQQLFSNAAAAAPASAAAAAVGGAAGLGGTAAAGGGEAGAVAPIAPPEEIGGFGDELEQDLAGFAAAGAVNPGLAGGGNRCSLSLSLTRTPGSAAGGSSGGLPQHPTPGTDAATAAGAGGAGFGPTPGSAGFTPVMQGYTPGYTPGSELNPDMPMDATADDDVLQPLDDANMGQLGREGASLGGADVLPDGWVGHDGEGKENAPAPGKGASSACGRMVWPADAETLLEQEAAGEGEGVGRT